MSAEHLAGRLAGRVALVTGASRGIGQAVAVAFAREGAELILVSRTVGGLEATDDAIRQAGGKPALLVPLDLTKLDGIDELAAALASKYSAIDVLVGNAGQLGMIGPLAQSDAKEFEKTLAINLTANYRLIRALDPLLHRSAAGRALFVTSGVAQSVMPHWNAYAISKVALEHMVALYAAETAESNIRAYCVDPGEVDTRMHAQAMPGASAADYPKPAQIVESFIQLAMANSAAPSGARVLAQVA